MSEESKSITVILVRETDGSEVYRCKLPAIVKTLKKGAVTERPVDLSAIKGALPARGLLMRIVTEEQTPRQPSVKTLLYTVKKLIPTLAKSMAPVEVEAEVDLPEVAEESAPTVQNGAAA